MVPEEIFQLAGNAAEIYEDQKVPAIFRPLAEATLNAVSLRNDDSILDVACGTGIVARTVRKKVGTSARIVGVDLNEGMINTARNMDDILSRSCEWHISDACHMPFDDATFSMIFCQQGLQFFPNESVALKEMKRVLRPQGRIALTIWSGPSAFFQALAHSLGKHVSDAVAERSLAPFTYKGHDKIETLLSALEFVDISRQELVVDRVLDNLKISIPKEIAGNPVGPDVQEKGDAIIGMIVDEVTEGISNYRRGSNYVIPQR